MSFYQTVPKLCKLLPRLASNHDGEVVATVAAIERTLHSVGLDWHDLADIIGQSGRQPDAASVLRDMAETLHGLPNLSAWEREFIPDMRRLLAAGARLTDKQEQALRRCYARHGKFSDAA